MIYFKSLKHALSLVSYESYLLQQYLELPRGPNFLILKNIAHSPHFQADLLNKFQM